MDAMTEASTAGCAPDQEDWARGELRDAWRGMRELRVTDQRSRGSSTRSGLDSRECRAPEPRPTRPQDKARPGSAPKPSQGLFLLWCVCGLCGGQPGAAAAPGSVLRQREGPSVVGSHLSGRYWATRGS
eukprot:14143964-Alexandrium_andersonii.AAC.1